MEPMQYALFPIIRSSMPPPPILTWKSNTVAGIAHYMLPPRLGGVTDDMTKPFTADEVKDGRPYEITGRILELPGLPRMYDWELHPQDASFMGGKPGVAFEMGNINFMCACPSPSRYEDRPMRNAAFQWPSGTRRYHLSRRSGLRQ